jgi:hypothetical protein
MTKRRTIVLMGRIIAAAVAAHLVWSLSVAAYLAGAYDHRLPNVRKLADTVGNWVPMAEVYAKTFGNSDKATVLFIGSSFSFGYSYADSIIFSRALAQLAPDASVANISIVGADQNGLSSVVGCALKDAGRRFDLILLELPLLNDNAHVRNRLTLNQPLPEMPRLENCGVGSESTWFEYVLRRPYGTQWVPLARDEFETNTRHREVALGPLPSDYVANAADYARIADHLSSMRTAYIEIMARFAHRVIVYPSLVYVDGLEKLGFDRTNIERQIADAIAACRNVSGALCLDTTMFSDRAELYGDVAHLNRNGHAVFGHWLFEKAQPVLAPGVARSPKGIKAAAPPAPRDPGS